LLLVAVLSIILCLPFLSSIFSLGDEGKLLHAAQRMLGGSHLYIDFFEFLPPAGFVLTTEWLRLAGISIWAARSLTILIIVGIACFTYFACRQASKNAPLSAFLALGWVVMSQGAWTQLNHHYVTTLLSMVAAWAALSNIDDAPPRLRWSLIAGAAAGTGAVVTSSSGALAALAGIIAFINPRHSWVRFIAYCLATALVPAAVLVYLVWHDAVTPAFYDVIVFPTTRYASVGTVPFGAFADVQSFPFLFLFPGLALLFLLICARDWRTFIRDQLLWASVAFAVAGFLGCFPRPDIVHLAFGAPLALPLLALSMDRLTKGWRSGFRYAVAGVVIGLCAPTVLAFLSITQQALQGKTVALPRGNVALINQPGAAELMVRLVALPSTDGFFFYPYMPMLPFLSAREHVGKYDEFIPGFTLPSQYSEACVSVLQRASWVVIDRRRTDPVFLQRLYPAMRDFRPPETRVFEKALDDNFELVAQEGAFELRRRRNDIDDGACAKILG
jgi:hypothetical protein